MDIDFSELRLKMVDGQLRTTDVTSTAILDAFLDVPREAFVPARSKPFAYIDEDVDITPPGDEERRFLMEPSPLARLLQLADISSSDLVLDVGCGTGYSSAILSRLAGSVIALESNPDLAGSASTQLQRLGHDNVAVVEGSLTAGYAEESPYDVIVLGGAVEFIPPALFEQLAEGGRLVAVEGAGNAGVARLYLKSGGHVASRRGFNAAVKPLPGFRKSPEFSF